MQFGPFAVAQLRVLAELIDLVTLGAGDASEERQKALSTELRLYITDTLADPDEEAAWIPANMAGIAECRRQANHIKRHEPITVVLGNPPYKEKAKGHGGWVEEPGDAGRSPLEDWQPPSDWGVGAHAKHLRNLYVYFWRWAAWKVFGGEAYRSGADHTPADWTRRKGIVCFITVAGFLNGPGFQKMRADLRRQADEILGDRLHAGTPSAAGVIAHFRGRPAARLHRHGLAPCEHRQRHAGQGALPQPSGR